MPDGIMEATRVIKSGEWVVIEGTFSGTQEGTLTLGRHTVPPTGKPLSFQYCTIAQEVDGKILSEAVYYDLVTIFEQLNGDTAEQASA
jgi:predicted ester cyclase